MRNMIQQYTKVQDETERQRDVKAKSLPFTLLFALTMVFCITRLYPYIGSSVWLLGCIAVIILMVRIQGRNRIMKEQLEMLKASQEKLEEVNAALEEEIQKHLKTGVQLAESEEKFRAIFEGASDPILILKNNRFIDCNLAALRIFGYQSKEKLLNQSPWEHSPIHQPNGENSQKLASYYMEQAKERKSIKFEWWHCKSNQSPFVVEIVLTPFILQKEKVLLSVWRDISERKKMEESLTYLSYHDQLTGFYNRRYFEEELKRMDTPRNLPLSVIFADINGLKFMNDTFGHKYGDDLIKRAAKIIRQECRSDEIIARVGGDEFVILLPKTDKMRAKRLVYRLRKRLAADKIRDIAMSIAFGVETKVKEGEKIYDLINRAECYMYRNKRNDKRKQKKP